MSSPRSSIISSRTNVHSGWNTRAKFGLVVGWDLIESQMLVVSSESELISIDNGLDYQVTLYVVHCGRAQLNYCSPTAQST